ncbi:RHS repeat domain-containing protein [Pseudomonas sp. ZS1P83]
MATNLHHHTPTVTGFDPRGLTVRSVAYCRSHADEPKQTRVNRQSFDVSARLIAQWDPRLWALTEEGHVVTPNLQTTYNLAQQPILTQSVDAGQHLTLFGTAGQVLIRWDSRGSQFCRKYNTQLRLVELHEQALGETLRCVERLRYAGSETDTGNNLRGQLMRHDDSGGSRCWESYDLYFQPQAETQRFLKAPDVPDWSENETERETWLELNRYSSSWVRDAQGEIISQKDAKGNLQTRHFTVAGKLKEVRLSLAGAATPQCLVGSIVYNALGQVLSETSGNGILGSAVYDPASGQLQRRQVRKSTNELLQDLRYIYDPVGNVLQQEDRAQPVQYHKNQRIEPFSTYGYDTLYQLIEASGKESILACVGPALPELSPIGDASRQRQYRQFFDYDSAGNMLELRHQAGDVSYRRKMKVAERSNRSLYWKEGEASPDPDSGFDFNGNQLALQQGQEMEWYLRNQLRRVSQVLREEASNDDEVYQYDAVYKRLRKIRTTKAKSLIHLAVVSYLPELELHTNMATGEIFQVINVQIGSGSVQILHWDSGLPAGLDNDRFRYNINNQLGSITLELDENGRVISHEEYHAHGTSAWWASGSAIEAKYKTIRYSCRTRDATGLHYYHFRYYASWLTRWISSDPKQAVDGLNLYCMVGNNPVSYRDSYGLNKEKISEDQIVPEEFRTKKAQEMVARIGQYEPALTALLDVTTKELGAELYGREYRLKTPESLAQKLSVAPPDQMNDVLRYTIGFPYGAGGKISESEQQEFVQGVVKAFYTLGSKGYKPVLIRNTFFSEQAYRGVNANFLLPDGKTKFEIQVHTAQSYKVKSEGHVRYEGIRNLERGFASGDFDDGQKSNIEAELAERRAVHREASAIISTPQGIQEWVSNKPELNGFKWQTYRLTSEQRQFYGERVKNNMAVYNGTQRVRAPSNRRNSV